MNGKTTRRKFSKQLGALVGGTVVLGPAVAGNLVRTPSQTEGPFYPPEPHAEIDVDLTLLEGHTERAAGDVILVRGRVLNLDGEPLAGARVDIWQANHHGKYAHPNDPNPAPLDPNFQGIGITHTDENGRYGFKTIKPAAYKLNALDPENSGSRAQHIHFKVAHAGTGRVTTQMYFEGDPLLEQDGPFNQVPEDQRHLLITTPAIDDESGLPVHEFDVVLA